MISKDFIWNIYSVAYDSLLHFTPYKELMARMIKDSKLEAGERVADLGSGTGNFEFLTRVNDVSFYCYDISESMIKRAKRKNPNCKFVRYDLSANKIPAKDGFFDRVISSNFIYNIRETDDFFKDISRVLKRGGLFIFTTSTTDGLSPLLKKHLLTMNLTVFFKTLVYLPAFLYVLVINLVIDRSKKYYFHKEVEIRDSLTRAGLRVVSVDSCYEGLNSIFVVKKV